MPLSQVVDALKDVFPIAKRHKAASEHANALESFSMDSQLEWENIFSGRYTDSDIMNRRHKLMKLVVERSEAVPNADLVVGDVQLVQHHLVRLTRAATRLVVLAGGHRQRMHRLAADVRHFTREQGVRQRAGTI